jgi:AraC-like DNA-binding protein
MPSLHLMVNFGDPFQVYEGNNVGPFATCDESWSLGLWNAYHIMDWPAEMSLLNVSFKPGGAYPFLRIPLSELNNQVVSLDAIWGPLAVEIRELLYAAQTVQARLALLEQLLLTHLREVPHGLDAVQYAVGEIARNHGALPIRALSDRIGISQKHLDTQFKRLVGATPKELARIYRFTHLLFSIDTAQPVDWTHVAFRFGYYDQSHLNKDFEAFTGHNPTGYLRLLHELHVVNPAIAPYPQHLPAG